MPVYKTTFLSDMTMRVTPRVSYKKKELFMLRFSGFAPVFGGVRVAYLFSFSVVLCFLFFFFLCLEHNVVCVSGLSTL